MATERQRQTSRKNSRSQSPGSRRQKPGSGGQGKYYHVEVRDGDDFETFRTQDVGDPGHLERVSGKRPSGSWATVKWLIAKEDAHVEDGRLVADTKDAKDLLKKLHTKPVQIRGDRFEARPRRNVSERSRPTAAQTRARRQNIRKAQSAQENSWRPPARIAAAVSSVTVWKQTVYFTAVRIVQSSMGSTNSKIVYDPKRT